MSTFISKVDYKYMIRTERMDQILESDDEDEDAILEDAEDEAIAMIKDYLNGKYDVDAIFSKSGSERPKNVLRWAKVIVIYLIYDRIPDEMVPERVVKNYDDVIERLNQISEGKLNVDLPLFTKPDEDGNQQPRTSIRIGSKKPRPNDGGSPRNLT